MSGADFDFFSEITKENIYELLYPKKEVGLAIVWLYQRSSRGDFPDSTFKEADIHEALDSVRFRPKHQPQRNSIEYYNKIIADLQEYFIRYDDEKQVYRFKEYANEFCTRTLATLKANFDPTQIEKICKKLTKELIEAETKEKIKDWLSITFDEFKPVLRQQIDFIERQIDNSVLKLRQKINDNKQAKIVQNLKEIDDRFDDIRSQNKELRAAFREFSIIKKYLQERSMSIDDEEIGDLIYSTLQFFQEMKRLLSSVDNQLDRIQPKIKQLFSNLNKPLFNTNIERFLRFLLDNSQIKTEKSKKLLEFPFGISKVEILRQLIKFSIVERRKDLFPAKSLKKIRYSENQASKQKAQQNARNRFIRQDIINGYLNRIHIDLKKKSEVKFSDYFFEALYKNDLHLAVELAYRVIRDKKIYDWRLDLSTQNDYSKQSKNVAIRKMIIRRAK
ncbi:MAG: hypothetical protein ACFB0B_19515 [Thermonemataceae bacterium]